jgi:Tol biopolymer transport system component
MGHGFPQFLPDGKHFLYFIQSGDAGTEGIYIASLDHPEERVQILKTNTKAVYTQPIPGGTGYLLWLREQTLLAQRFDAGKLRLQGDRMVVVQNVALNAIRRPAFWVSDAGLLVYRTGATRSSRMAWTGRDGKRAEQFLQSGGVADFRLSPDGKRAAFGRQVSTGSQNLWLLEFSRGGVTRLTFGAKADYIPSWSPDGHQIAFSSDRSGILQIYRKDADGGGREEQLTGDPNNKQLTDWSRDGKFLLYSEEDPKTVLDLWALPLDGPRKPIPILQTPLIEDQGQFSPDGKWVAYQSNESGGAEVYVTTFPSSTRKWQISNHGGVWPRWRGDGKELFYLSSDRKMMAVTIRTSAVSVQADTPRDLFAASFISQQAGSTPPYDVTADGQRFLLLEQSEVPGGIPPLRVVMNWDADLKK